MCDLTGMERVLTVLQGFVASPENSSVMKMPQVRPKIVATRRDMHTT